MGRGVLMCSSFYRLPLSGQAMCTDANVCLLVCLGVSVGLSLHAQMDRWTDGLLRTPLEILLITTLVPRDDSR